MLIDHKVHQRSTIRNHQQQEVKAMKRGVIGPTSGGQTRHFQTGSPGIRFETTTGLPGAQQLLETDT